MYNRALIEWGTLDLKNKCAGVGFRGNDSADYGAISHGVCGARNVAALVGHKECIQNFCL